METLNLKKHDNARLPENPGVYLFKKDNREVLYVGKSKSLKSRIRAYFSPAVSGKTKQMIKSASRLSFIETTSEMEALLLEASLVSRHMPRFNAQLRDDKSPLYIGITAEPYPRVITLRQTQVKTHKPAHVFGPYVDAGSTKRLLKYTRRAIPFCTHRPGKRACVYHEMGLCDPCPSVIEAGDPAEKKRLRRAYLANTRRIRKILSGDIKVVAAMLKKDMARYAKAHDYEKAARAKGQIEALERMNMGYSGPELYLKDPNLASSIKNKEALELRSLLQKYIDLPRKIKRIEAYDVSHIAGASPTASMVTFTDGEPDKHFYRHFRVKLADNVNNDYEAMKHILERRKWHKKDWGMPDLVMVDGGKPQVKAAVEVFSDEIPTVGIAKKKEEFVFKTQRGFKQFVLPRGHAKNLVQRIRDEAHRFARRYHHKLVARELFALRE